MRDDESDPVEDIYALTPLQEGLLFHTVGAQHGGLYVVQWSWTLRGVIDVSLFSTAWQATIARHPALRAAFEWEGLERPVQLVYREAPLPFIALDWRTSSATLGDETRRYLAEDRARGFDLDQAPLHRVTLARLGDRQWWLVWSHHQAAIDGWSAGLLLEEVAGRYAALRAGGSCTFAPTRPHRDYVAWLQARDLERAEAFWRARLRGVGAPAILQPTITTPDAHVAVGARARSRRLTREASASLRARLREARLTPSTLTQAAWACVMARRAQTVDVVFGAVVSGRPSDLDGIEGMVGFFINTIPARIKLDEQLTVRVWMERIQGEFLEARAFEHSALADVQRWAGVPRQEPLFTSIVAYENYPTGGAGWGDDLEITHFEADEEVSFGLALYAGLIDECFVLRLSSDPGSYSDETVEQVLDELLHTIDRMLVGLDQRVSALFELSASARAQLASRNATAVELPLETSFSELFARQVQRTPQRRAVVHRGEALSYAGLEARARAVACTLRACGVGPGSLVGILANRSADFLVTILGVFEAGGAYLPLDPRAPPARLTQVLARASVGWVVRSDDYGERTARALAGLDGARPIELALETLGSATPAPFDRGVRARDLAYVIFTSGSTGQPKGAMVEGRGMVNHLFAKIRDLGLGPHDRVAQNASQCFDISVWQFLAALLVGGETHIYGDEIALDPRGLLNAVDADGITILETVPSFLRALLDRSDHDAAAPPLSSLRWMIPTGEALPPELASRWLGRFPQIAMLNAYGPTECSDDVTHHVLRTPPPPDGLRIPIGRPVANTRMHVLDDRLRPLPLGVVGELYVGGEGVGRGYIADPRRTAVAFLPDPFSARPGARLYRTGDLARLLPDGELDFLGRVDHQIKLRGFRIELGDIEAALRDHPAINECVAVVRAAPGGHEFLVGYFTSGAAPSGAALREHLAARLPDYMIPQHFVNVAALPLTANGKLDRSALPDVEAQAVTDGRSSEAPREGTEARIAASWCAVLGLDRVGPTDNFFDLGGHSLLLLRVLDDLRAEHPRLGVLDLFQYPVVRSLARHLDGEHAPSARADAGRGASRRQALQRQRQRRR